MKKLLFFIPTLNSGGAEKVLVDIVNNLDQKKYEITVMTLLNNGIYEKRLKANILLQSVIKSKYSFFRKCLDFAFSFLIPNYLSSKLLLKDKYDIVISFLEGTTTKILSSAKLKAKKMAFVHTDFSSNYQLYKLYKSFEKCYKSYLAYDKVVFVSEGTRRGFEKTIGYLDRSIVLHNFIDKKKIVDLSREELKEERSSKFLFISVGRLCPQKGYDRLIEASARLRANGYEFDIWILGEGDDRSKLESLINKYKMDNVRLLGYKNNPYKYMSRADMYICSSRAEGYSTAVLESLVLGKPVLATSCAGMDELLENREYGCLVENSTDGIFSGMKKILENSEQFTKCLLAAKNNSISLVQNDTTEEYEILFDTINDDKSDMHPKVRQV